MVKIRKAVLADVAEIHRLVAFFAKKDLMLARPLNYLYENIRAFWVAEENGVLAGCCGLHIVWVDLAEIKSLAVSETYKGQRIGTRLVRRCLREAKRLGIQRVFALTYVPVFFKKLGFQRFPKSKLPHKIWSDCLNCPKFPDCGEVSVAITFKNGDAV